MRFANIPNSTKTAKVILEMKHLIIYLFFLFIVGCDSESNTIDDDFTISYVDEPVFRNIYYKNQGIFSNISVFYVVFDNDNIMLKGYLLDKNRIDTLYTSYYEINKKEYILDPNQEKSKGVIELKDQKAFDKNLLLLKSPRDFHWSLNENLIK